MYQSIAGSVVGIRNLWTSVYPPAHSDTYVKATTKLDTLRWPYFATDPALSVVDTYASNSWLSDSVSGINQRFHIDLGSPKIVTRIYYENFHNSGSATGRGAQNFTFWGSNAAGDFADLTYANDGTWEQITGVSQSTFDRHSDSNIADPKYITILNTSAYRYYAFKFSDSYGEAYIGVRRIELQENPIVAEEISGSITTESAITGDATEGILFLNHLNLGELSMGGVVADKPMDSVFIVQKLTTAFSTRWLVG